MNTSDKQCAAFYSGGHYTPATSVGLMLRRLSSSMRSEIETRMARHGITAAQWHPMLLLKLGKVATALELARELEIDAGATTRMVDRLAAKGLVERVRSDSDRRVVNLRLTPAGEEIAALLPHVLASVQNDFLGGFSSGDFDELRRLLLRMLENGEALRAARPPGDVAGQVESDPQT